MQKKNVVVVKRQAEHGGLKRPKYNVGEHISSYGIEWCSFSQNPYIDDIAFSKQTLMFSYALIARKWQRIRHQVFEIWW